MITITGEPKEIAALVVALQERRVSVNVDAISSMGTFDPEEFSRQILLQLQAKDCKQGR